MAITINLRKPEMKTKTLAVSFEKDKHEAYYAIVNHQFIVPLDKKIREDYVRQLRASGHHITILPDVRMVATARPGKRMASLNDEQREALAQLLAGEADPADMRPLEELLGRTAS